MEREPLRERRWLLLALAQYQSGSQADALGTFREVRTALSRELGVDPGPDLVALEQAVLRQDPALVAAVALPEPRATCPYRGLLPYEVADAEDFHGREQDVTACRERLAEVGAVTVVGPSGSGKSSLVRAGIAAGLQAEGHKVLVITPGPHPMDALAVLPGTGRPPVLVVDQCEEACTLCSDPGEREAFFTALTVHAERGPLVVALRVDRLGDITGHPEFTRLVERSLHVLNPMSADDLRTAIEEPARRAGLRLEPGLVDLLVREAQGQTGALPLLSHALRATWERREAATLTVAGYRATGGVGAAIAQSAESVYEAIPADQRPLLRSLLLRLVTPNPEGDPIRSRLPRRSLAGAPTQVQLAETLVAARLLTTDEDVLELAHESLARAWPRLREWLEEDAEGQRILRHLLIAADTWHTMGRPDSELYRGLRLAQAVDWRHRTHPELTPIETQFLDESRRLAEHEEHAAAEQARHQRHINRRLRGLLAGISLVTVAALIATVIAVTQQREADRRRAEAIRQSHQAVARALVNAARDAAGSNPGLSLLLAAEASAATPTPVPGATDALFRARVAFANSRVQPVGRPLVTNVDSPSLLAFSPDGKTLAGPGSGGSDIRLWDVDTGKALGRPIPGGPMAWDPQGRWIATSDRDGTITLRDPRTGSPVREMDESHVVGGRTTLAVAPHGSGSLLASGERDGTVRLWDPATGRPVRELRVPRAGPIAALAFDPRGRTLAVGTERGPVTVWDLTSAGTARRLPGQLDGVWPLAFSDDGRLLAASAYTGAVHVWTLSDSKGPGRTLTGHTDDVFSLAFSPDGDQLVSASYDGTVRLWETATGRTLGKPRSGFGAAFGPDGSLAYSGADGVVHLWNAASAGTERGTRERTRPGWNMTFGRQGEVLASATRGGIVQLWRIGPHEPLSRPRPELGLRPTWRSPRREN